MVDASLRPRPTFGTILQSDNSVNDGLSYYDYQRLVRSKKVTLLQERRERSHEPGYKKEATGSNTVGPVSRKIFQLKSRVPSKSEMSHSTQGMPAIVSTDARQMVSSAHLQKEDSTSKVQLSPLHAASSMIKTDNVITDKDQPEQQVTQTQSERLPRIKNKVRMVKSATARDHQQSSPSHGIRFKHERPKTVSSIRDYTLYNTGQEGTVQNKEVQTEAAMTTPEHQPSIAHRRAYTEGSAQVVDIEDSGQKERDALVKAYTWRTSSQRATDEIGWNERVPSPPVPPPASTIEQFPDPVSMRLTFRRYHSEPAEWQNFGTEWDYVQSRPGSFTKGPQGINYSSSSQNTQQIPGYHGHIPGRWLMDNPTSTFNPTLLIRSLKPRPTNISRRANIPGYTGQVHWANIAAAHSDMPLPEPTTSARTHRHIPLEEEVSPYTRTGVFSKMMTTVSPHNPYNKVEY